MRIAIWAWTVLVAVSLSSAGAAAQTMTVPFAARANISGVELAFPVQVTLAQPAPGGRVAVLATIDLTDFRAKIDALFRAAGLDRPPGDYSSFDYRGTLVEAKDGRLWAKYHFNIRKRPLPASNGSVELFFRPVVEGNALRLAGEEPKLSVSNDITRSVARALGLEEKLKTNGLAAVDRFLAGPDARLQVPNEFAGMQLMLKAARFASDAGKLTLVVEGELDPAQGASAR